MSEQQIPKKMKKKKNLKEEDKEKCDNYYSEVKLFIDKNDTAISRKLKNLDYFFEYDKKEDLFISDKYDQSLETYGYYNKTQKKMYLSIEEAFYLNQICLINFKPEFNFNDLNLVDLYLYSYLRRAAKIILVGKILLLSYVLNQKDEEKDNKNKKYEINDIEKYYILFENKQDYKDHKIKSILYQHDSEQNLNYLLFQNIINNSKKLYNLYLEVNNKKYDEFKAEIILCITQGVSITFLKLNDTIKI
jgi:hypothetical protein